MKRSIFRITAILIIALSVWACNINGITTFTEPPEKVISNYQVYYNNSHIVPSVQFFDTDNFSVSLEGGNDIYFDEELMFFIPRSDSYGLQEVIPSIEYNEDRYFSFKLKTLKNGSFVNRTKIFSIQYKYHNLSTENLSIYFYPAINNEEKVKVNVVIPKENDQNNLIKIDEIESHQLLSDSIIIKKSYLQKFLIDYPKASYFMFFVTKEHTSKLQEDIGLGGNIKSIFEDQPFKIDRVVLEDKIDVNDN